MLDKKLFFSDLPVSTLLQEHKICYMPQSQDDVQRIVVRRRHIWSDTVRKLKGGLDVNKHIKVSFVGDVAVDEGGPRREFLTLLMRDMAGNNSLFQGKLHQRLPRPNLVELNKRSFYCVGLCIAMSLVHGGPNPAFFAPSVARYGFNIEK